MQEPHFNFTVEIKLPSGLIITDKQMAVSKWHAIDKAFTKYSDKQSDRTKYRTWTSFNLRGFLNN